MAVGDYTTGTTHTLHLDSQSMRYLEKVKELARR